MYKVVEKRERRSKTPEQALSSLMRLASRGEKSSGDALRLMSGWGVDPERRQEVLQRLIGDGFIDDRRYAAAYVREKTRLAGWGAYKIRRALAVKGISPEIIVEALGEIDGEAAERRLEQMLQRKASSVKSKDVYDLKGKLVRYGLSLGYDYDRVIPAVEKIIKE